jgi:hypothetical protein
VKVKVVVFELMKSIMILIRWLESQVSWILRVRSQAEELGVI